MLEKFRFGLVVVAIAALGLFAIACSEEEVEEATNTTSATGAAAAAKEAGVTPAKAQTAMEKPAEKKAEPKLVETSQTSKPLQQMTKLLDWEKVMYHGQVFQTKCQVHSKNLLCVLLKLQLEKFQL